MRFYRFLYTAGGRRPRNCQRWLLRAPALPAPQAGVGCTQEVLKFGCDLAHAAVPYRRREVSTIIPARAGVKCLLEMVCGGTERPETRIFAWAENWS
jgi:hypothetical protein